MTYRNEISEELKSLGSKLADMPRTMPYALPQGYFESLEAQLKMALQYEAAPALSFTTKAMPYDIPKGYFNNLPEALLEKIKEQEATAALPKAKASASYILPEGYFDDLPMQMLEAAKAADKKGQDTKPAQTKTIPLGRNNWQTIQWAAAAILLLVISIGSYRIIQQPVQELSTEQQLAQLPDGTISEYVQQNIDDFDMDIIAANYTGTNANAATTTLSNGSQLNDDEIINYLNETGWGETTIN